ncbi:hypothetical protein IC608_14070 [Devosia sp. PTR5]|uniref:Uncharacterized protein n=1 Tax=Devosia oryzisoli TaxID=2774138 RepID=A0A927FWI5_9HYPH|nr:hypothetical protein [Devosia oryzisoli]MBD8066597.1 hypothetical protein [Devosia oryzisoli]
MREQVKQFGQCAFDRRRREPGQGLHFLGKKPRDRAPLCITQFDREHEAEVCGIQFGDEYLLVRLH